MKSLAFNLSNELILAQSSLTGVNFEQRVAAAAAGGFTGIGLSLDEYDRLRATGISDEEMLCILAVYDVKVAELEGLEGFAAPGNRPENEAAASSRKNGNSPLNRLLHLAELFHAHHLQVTGTPNTEMLEDDAVEKFAHICDQASERRLRVSLEPRAKTNIASLQIAANIVSSAQRGNAGIGIDSWQYFRAKTRAEDVTVPVDLISMIRLSDGSTGQDAGDEDYSTAQKRRAPGEGNFDLTGLLRTLTQHDVSAPISVEVTSYNSTLSDPFDICAYLGDKTSSIRRLAAVS